MDWFRNVPNVIRNSNHTDQTSRSDERNYEIQENNTDKQQQNRNNMERQGSRDEYNSSIFSTSVIKPVIRKNPMQEQITCALCGEVYTDPRLLPCLHSFCKRCLEHTINPRSTTLTCHLCRKEIQLKINGVAEFPLNFILNNLIDIEAVRNSTSKAILCNSCNEQLPATARCLDCMDFLCYACHSAHSRVRMTKDHQILTVEQLKRSDDISNLLHRPVYCQTHQDEKVTYYCITCQQTICRECVISGHQQNNHDYTLISKAITQQKEEIISLKRVIEQKLPMLNCATTNLNETQHKLDSRCALIKSEIKERSPRLIKLIEEKEESMLTDLSKLVTDKKAILNKQHEYLKTEYQKFETINKFTEQILTTGTDAEVLSLKNALCEKLKIAVKTHHNIEPEVDDQISCDTNIEDISNAIHSYGQLSTSGEEFLKCFVLGNVTTVVKGQISQLTLVIKNQYSVETSCKKQDLEAEIKTPEYGVLVPEIREKTESTFLLSFRTYSIGIHQLSIKFKGKPISGSPFSITVINPGGTVTSSEVYQSESQKNNPATTNIKSPTEPRSPISFNKPLSLDINDMGDYAVIPQSISPQQKTDNFTTSNILREHTITTTDNISVKEIKKMNQNKEKVEARFLFSVGRRGTQLGEFHGVFGVASDHINKRIIATDCHNNRIQVFTEEGKFLFTFGQRGNNDGEFQSPTGVGVGPNGEIVVCERLKGRIQVFNSNGDFQRRFVLNQLKASTLAVDTSGRIIIADYTNCCVYILDPILERWSKFGYFGQGDGELQYPCYVATDRKGNIYVSDMNSNKIQMYDADSLFIRSFGTKGDKNGEFLHPTGITIDVEGRLIVSDRDNHRIQIIESTGEFYAKFGSKGEHDGELNDTHGLAALSNGNIAAADLKNNRIQVFSVQGS